MSTSGNLIKTYGTKKKNHCEMTEMYLHSRSVDMFTDQS